MKKVILIFILIFSFIFSCGVVKVLVILDNYFSTMDRSFCGKKKKKKRKNNYKNFYKMRKKIKI